ncbi:MAG: T9SS type A sorting domain-containing protein [Ignavibacteriae bacterium]|nr:T9SS type A sorting domain-containing protein [Ignavibacteriota bacterium]MCB9214346.1 T9SS type A sorting domain-containing protein [Ignavibacteria bacterium]
MKGLQLLLLCLLLALPKLLSAQELLENFEEWTERDGTEMPVGWNGMPFGSGRATDAHQGTSAASVWNWYAYALGILAIGEKSPLWFDLKYSGVPIDFIPSKLIGYYKYQPGMNKGRGEKSADSGIVYILLKSWNEEKGDIDTISFTSHQFPENNAWERFEIDIPISNPWVMPDSIAIVFYSSHPERTGFCGPDSMNCCYLSVDDLALVATSGVPYSLNHLLAPARVVPNPVLHSATIEFDGKEGVSYNLRLFDATGREVYSAETTTPSFEVSRVGLPAGSYHFTVTDDRNLSVTRGAFTVE